MDRMLKKSVVIWITLAVAVQLAHAQGVALSPTSFNKITKEEIQLLLKDVASSNPDALKKLADPESRQQQIDSLKQLLAFASQAQKDGLADFPTNRQELRSIRSEVIAVNYDKEINTGKGPMPPFGNISDARVKAFWTAGETAKTRESEFAQFLDAKLELLKAGSSQMSDRVPSQEEKEQAREFFAKVKIYEGEYESKRNTLSKNLRDKIDLQIKLQQAQFLARQYSEKIAERVKITDTEIDSYISKHPELDTSAKRAKAEKILTRAKAGEDFAKLANEFSEDPGNKSVDGKLQGGLYQNVGMGVMVPPFEKAALALSPGEVSPGLVESDFGYHIVKLEKKGPSPDDPKKEVYDVRHILISTTFDDPAGPGRSVPLRSHVRGKLEGEKEKLTVDELIRANNIQVAEDFELPDVSAKTAAVKKAPVSKKRKPVRRRR